MVVIKANEANEAIKDLFKQFKKGIEVMGVMKPV